MITTPKRLMPGNRIAIISPSSTFKVHELQDGIDTISSMGLVPVLGPNVRNLRVHKSHAAPLEERVKELMWAFTAPDIQGILCARGGYGAAETLQYLDFNAIRASRRVFIGKSDATSLINGILTKAGMASILGRTASIRNDYADSDVESLEHTIKLCMSSVPWGDQPFSINDIVPRTVSPGTAAGISIGGNLETMCTLLGTDYFPDPTGAILFLEDVHKGGMSVARKLLHLKMAGVLDSIAGIVIGEFFDIPEMSAQDNPSIEEVILEYLGGTVPCVYGFSFSHGTYTCPIPIGAYTILDADRRTVSFDFTMGR